MFLSRFGVKNYKCLGEIDIPLTPIHVLVGENDAGKTSLLEAMAAFCASSAESLSNIFPMPWHGHELVLHGSHASSIEFCGEWKAFETDESVLPESTSRYGFAVDVPSEGHECTTQGDWIEVAGENQRVLQTPSEVAEKMILLTRPARATTSVQQWKASGTAPPADAQDLRAILRVLQPAQRYALNAKLMAVPVAFRTTRRFKLDPDGLGLATLLDDILGFEPEIFLRIQKEFCEYFTQFRTVRVQTELGLRRDSDRTGIDTSSRQDGKGIHFETQTGHTIRAQQASDGAILFLGFLALAHLPDPPNLLLIEEPENGIYPKRLGQVIKLLKEMVHRTEGVRFPQIIMSTHSPYVLSFFEPEEVTFLSRPADQPDGPVRARPLRDAPNIHERMGGEFYLGELWYNLSEKELFSDP